MKILLIWEEVPESTSLYLIDASPKESWMIKKCHGQFSNTVGADEKALKQLSVFLVGRTPIDKEAPFVVDGPVTIVLSGFML